MSIVVLLHNVKKLPRSTRSYTEEDKIFVPKATPSSQSNKEQEGNLRPSVSVEVQKERIFVRYPILKPHAQPSDKNPLFLLASP